jgi:hypothetical protein
LSTRYRTLESPCESFVKHFTVFIVDAVQRPTYSFRLTADSRYESFLDNITRSLFHLSLVELLNVTVALAFLFRSWRTAAASLSTASSIVVVFMVNIAVDFTLSRPTRGGQLP